MTKKVIVTTALILFLASCAYGQKEKEVAKTRVAGNEACTNEIKLLIQENAWQKRLFLSEEPEVRESDAATLAIVKDPKKGNCLAVGPWRRGKYAARYEYIKLFPFTTGTIRGWYRTENLTILKAGVMGIWFKGNRKQKTIKFPLLPVSEWTMFELPMRFAFPGSDSVTVGISNKTEGRVLFSDISICSDVMPLDPGTPRRITRPRPPKSFKKSGFVRLEKTGGAWWLVTPEGRPFFSFGTDIFAFEKGKQLQRASELQDAGFNSFAGWSGTKKSRRINNALMRNDRPSMYAFKSMNTGRLKGSFDDLVDRHGKAIGRWGRKHAFPDPFDPDYEVAYRKAFLSQLKAVKGKPWFAGWFIDNERNHANLYRHVYSTHCSKAFLNFLRNRYDTIKKLNTQWGLILHRFRISW